MNIVKKKAYFKVLMVLIFCLVSLTASQFFTSAVRISPYPDGKNFAFTIVDDPDGIILSKANAIYTFLDEIGLKTTIACWVYKPADLRGLPDPQEQTASETLKNQPYLEFIKGYSTRGFEIALHTVTSGNDKRVTTLEGYEKFKQLLGNYPKINIMHSKNLDNIYWGRNVFTNKFMRWIIGFYDKADYGGENPKSEYFWGDICKDKTKYIRLWGTSDINTLKYNPSMPYHDNKKPFVNYWFSFSDGYNAYFFNKLLSEANIKKLVKERGTSIVYTHFAAGFCKKDGAEGRYILNDETRNKLLYLSKQKDGWFVPVGEILDRLLETKNITIVRNRGSLIIYNNNPNLVRGVTLLVKPFIEYRNEAKENLRANGEGEIIIGNLQPGEKKIIYITCNLKVINLPRAPNLLEYVNLVWQRIKIMFLEHRG